MAPEQLEGGEIGPHTDVYALSVVAFEAALRQPRPLRPHADGDRASGDQRGPARPARGLGPGAARRRRGALQGHGEEAEGPPVDGDGAGSIARAGAARGGRHQPDRRDRALAEDPCAGDARRRSSRGRSGRGRRRRGGREPGRGGRPRRRRAAGPRCRFRRAGRTARRSRPADRPRRARQAGGGPQRSGSARVLHFTLTPWPTRGRACGRAAPGGRGRRGGVRRDLERRGLIL